jgi:hypothetical protein
VISACVASLCAEIRRIGKPAEILAATSPASEKQLLGALETFGRDLSIGLRLFRLRGAEEGAALATLLRALARDEPAGDEAFLLMSTETALEPGSLLGALTLLASSPSLHGVAFRENHARKATGRPDLQNLLAASANDVFLASQALSGTVLPVRTSVVRARSATAPGVVGRMARGACPGLPRCPGSSRSGRPRRILFAPSLGTRSLAAQSPSWSLDIAPPSGIGQMLGQNGLGARGFAAWSILDRRLAAAATLLGPVLALAGTAVAGPAFLLAWIAYVASTRLVGSLLLLGHSFEMRAVPHLYLGQLKAALSTLPVAGAKP